RDAQEPPDFGVGVTGETEVALTEEFEMMSTAPARGAPGADDTGDGLPAVLALGESGDLSELADPAELAAGCRRRPAAGLTRRPPAPAAGPARRARARARARVVRAAVRAAARRPRAAPDPQ